MSLILLYDIVVYFITHFVFPLSNFTFKNKNICHFVPLYLVISLKLNSPRDKKGKRTLTVTVYINTRPNKIFMCKGMIYMISATLI